MTNQQTAPGTVRAAVLLTGLSLVVGIVRAAMSPSPNNPALPVWFGPVVTAITFLIMGGLLAAMASGRRWAFVVFLVLYLSGLPAALPFARQQLATNLSGFMVFMFQTLSQGIALGALSTPSARMWFAARKAQRLAAASQERGLA